jgi:hypothetical protein
MITYAVLCIRAQHASEEQTLAAQNGITFEDIGNGASSDIIKFTGWKSQAGTAPHAEHIDIGPISPRC